MQFRALGDKARDCFLKSSLSHHHLWEIWYVDVLYLTVLRKVTPVRIGTLPILISEVPSTSTILR